MTYKDLADLIFPNAKNIEYYEEKYSARNLKEGAVVTRFAPSPTGFVHLGSLYASLVESRVAKQTEGIFYLRVEDTDTKREIENGTSGIVESLKDFGINIDEGMTGEDTEIGEYGPYKQSARKEIYEAYAKYLIEKGLVYPCFCKEEELNEIRAKQEDVKVRPGYYGIWAKCRNITVEESIDRIKNGENYILRLKSLGNPEKTIIHQDIIKGKIEFPENDQDIVIIKSDGLPTYHFAHAIDDHLMRTTHVIRGDEWISSVPLHLQLFYMLGFKAPKYAHIAPIMKDEDGAKRKLSKRKDPEAAVEYYKEQGIPKQAVMEYLLNIANSNFEDWKRQNPDTASSEFKIDLKKMSVSGALFDMVKLSDVSKNIISKFSAEMVYNETILWAENYDKDLKAIMEKDVEYTKQVLNIERRNVKPRKDIAKWSDIKDSIIYMYDDEFYNSSLNYEFMKITDKQEIKNILELYLNEYLDLSDDKETWFNKMKDLAEKLGYAREVKEFKQNPDAYKGHVGDISTVIRVALTSRQNTPDMYEIMQILGKESISKRLELCLSI